MVASLVLLLASRAPAAADEAIRHMTVATPKGDVDVTYMFATVSANTVAELARELHRVARGDWKLPASDVIGAARDEDRQSVSVPDLDAMIAALRDD